MGLFYDIKYDFLPFFFRKSPSLYVVWITGKIYKDETVIIHEKRIVSRRERWAVLRERHHLEAYPFEALKSEMFAVRPSVEFLIGLAVVDEVIGIMIELDIPGSIAPGVSCELIPIARSTLIGGRGDMDVLSCIGRIPVECKESELRIVVISSEIVAYSITVIILVPVRSRSAGSPTG